MGKAIETLANLTFIVLCVVVGVQALKPRPTPSATSAAPQPPPAMYQVGEGIAVPGIDFKTSDRTLLLVIRSTCRYCTESMPFYETLIGATREKATRVIAISPEPRDTTKAYLSTYNVAVDEIVTLPMSALKVRGTPTVLLIDRSAKVRQVWPGLLAQGGQEELLSAVNGAS